VDRAAAADVTRHPARAQPEVLAGAVLAAAAAARPPPEPAASAALAAMVKCLWRSGDEIRLD